jgi:putative DNA primase/helicase
VTIADDTDCDKQLPQKLLAELAGILRWAVEGCIDWQKVGLDPPKEVLAATAEYRDEMDVVGDFIAERCSLSPNARTLGSDLYAAYGRWCDERNEYKISFKAFGSSVERDGITKTKSSVTYYVGIILVPRQGVVPLQGLGATRSVAVCK